MNTKIKEPSFYTHYGIFYKLTDTYLLTVGPNLILCAQLGKVVVTERKIKSIENGEYGEISEGMFADQFDKTIESLTKLRT